MFPEGLIVQEWKGELDIIELKIVPDQKKEKNIAFVIYNRFYVF